MSPRESVPETQAEQVTPETVTSAVSSSTDHRDLVKLTNPFGKTERSLSVAAFMTESRKIDIGLLEMRYDLLGMRMDKNLKSQVDILKKKVAMNRGRFTAEDRSVVNLLREALSKN